MMGSCHMSRHVREPWQPKSLPDCQSLCERLHRWRQRTCVHTTLLFLPVKAPEREKRRKSGRILTHLAWSRPSRMYRMYSHPPRIQ